MKNDMRITRRGALKVGATFAAGAAAVGSLTDAATAAENFRRFERQRAVNARQRILLKGGTIISMDHKVGDLEQGDVLIEGKKIAAIAPELNVAGAQVIDAQEAIILPGFVDCHRHSWEAPLRRINPNSPTLADYGNATHLSFAKAYRPQDHYAANYLTAVGCIDAGITCVIDNSHNSRSPEHSDAAVEALIDGGIRAVHASGPPTAGDWAHQWPQDLERLQKKYFSSADQLVTLRMFSGVNRDNWAFARKLGLHITTEFQGAQAAALLDPLAQDKLVGPDNTFNHCGALPEKTWQIFVDTGASINVCPRSDAQYALGEGICALQTAWDHGIKPGLSVDNETSYSTDMFTEMRVALYLQRAVAQNRRFSGDQNPPKPLMVRDVLYCATTGGALCAGLDDKIGSLAPGKEADLIMVRADDINLYPSNNAVGTVVQAAERSNVDTVIIGGRVRKYRGKIVGLDMRRLKAMVEESRNHLFAAVGYRPDVFAELLPKLS
ncbi:MAG TPA: amidohydrolase family protein [Xanthobacteraceae bacterium]|nr:amidohydrolase family protein [Xanthobacteraceae bacterium]